MASLIIAAIVAVVVVVDTLSMTSQAPIEDSDTVNYFERCEVANKEIEQESRATIVDNSPSRLHSTWLSQECEVRAGPEYIIRKYSFFENGTFLLLRHHYAEESCSIATHTVTIRGSVKLLGPSDVVSGATETKFHIDAVNIIPLNRQVAHKLGHKLNLTCGPQPRWRPYVPQLIYEQPQQYSATPLWHGPIYNSLQTHSFMRKRFGTDCLESFGIEFDELKLLRVQRKTFQPKTYDDASYQAPRFELLLANTAPNVHLRSNYKPTSLQTTVMVRADTTSGCPVCSSISRGTEFSPPLLHEAAALPALIGGYWLSERCESSEGGIWSRRQFQIYSGDRLWTARWDYYDNPQCSMFLYAVTAAGSYVQRAGRQRRHKEFGGETIFDYFRTLDASAKFLFKRNAIDTWTIIRNDFYRNSLGTSANGPSREEKELPARIEISVKTTETTRNNKTTRLERSLTDNVYQLLYNARSSTVQSRFAAMLRGHQTRETTTKKSTMWNTLSGSTELDLHIAESILIPGDAAVATRCGAGRSDMLLTTWTRNCVPRVVEAPSTLGLRAKLGVNWNGQYTLLLGSRDDNVWEAPLRQCAQIPSHNPALRAHLRRSVGLRFGLLSSASTKRISRWYLLSQFFLCCLYYFLR